MWPPVHLEKLNLLLHNTLATKKEDEYTPSWDGILVNTGISLAVLSSSQYSTVYCSILKGAQYSCLPEATSASQYSPVQSSIMQDRHPYCRKWLTCMHVLTYTIAWCISTSISVHTNQNSVYTIPGHQSIYYTSLYLLEYMTVYTVYVSICQYISVYLSICQYMSCANKIIGFQTEDLLRPWCISVSMPWPLHYKCTWYHCI